MAAAPAQGALPAPDDPAPRGTELTLSVATGETVRARDDVYSDRIRCDHATVRDGGALGRALRRAARACGRGRVVALAPARLRRGLQDAGLVIEAVMPGYYRGTEACVVAGEALDPGRCAAEDAAAVAAVDALIGDRASSPTPRADRPAVPTERAAPSDAPAIAALITASFDHYPTPSGVPDFVAGEIASGVPFRVVRDEGAVVACASADLQRVALTAELTDCATRPDQRGRGLMQALLGDLMGDLRAMGYPTAYTLARAVEPGMNLAFQRLGFVLRGRMGSSCRIGTGFEDMNVWSRYL